METDRRDMCQWLMIIIDETLQEEESDTTRKEGHDSTDGMKMGTWEKGQDGVRRKSYSAAVIDGIKRNAGIYVGDSIARKTDSYISCSCNTSTTLSCKSPALF